MQSRMIVRVGGLAGIGVGLFILPFAAIDGIIGGLFAPEVLCGASGADWLAHIPSHPFLARIAITLPILGFSFMLVVGVTLYRLIADKHWGALLGLVGYLIGVPLAISTFVSATSLVWTVLGGSIAYTVPIVTAELHRFMLINFAISPFFIIVVGNTCMSLAAWRTEVLPRWLCIWGLVNGVIMAAGIGSVLWPVFGPAQIGGPLTMLWFMSTGVVLLRRSGRGDELE